MTVKIATWNVNSIRIRNHLMDGLVKEASPDVICLQETKVEDALFPHDALSAFGYKHIAASGQKSYNGVAILSKYPLSDIERLDVLGNGSKRHIAATLPDGTRVHSFYVPAGGDIPDREENPKFGEKLDFMDWLIGWATHKVDKHSKTVIMGDFNIAPHEQDVWSHKQLLKVVSHTPIEIEKMFQLQDTIGWIDTAREFTPLEDKLYSWWSYRNRDWQKSNRGRRLDHIWLTPGLKAALAGSQTLSHTRSWEKPSDHVPVIVELDLAL